MSSVCTDLSRILPTPRMFKSGYANTGKKFSSCLNIAFLEKYCYFVGYKQFFCKRKVSQCIRKCTEFTRINAAALVNFFLQKCGAYLRAVLNTIVIPLNTVFTRISAALINSPQMQRLFEGSTHSSNYCNWQIKSLLHLEQIAITFRTLLHFGQIVITFRTLLHLGQERIKGTEKASPIHTLFHR